MLEERGEGPHLLLRCWPKVFKPVSRPKSADRCIVSAGPQSFRCASTGLYWTMPGASEQQRWASTVTHGWFLRTAKVGQHCRTWLVPQNSKGGPALQDMAGSSEQQRWASTAGHDWFLRTAKVGQHCRTWLVPQNSKGGPALQDMTGSSEQQRWASTTGHDWWPALQDMAGSSDQQRWASTVTHGWFLRTAKVGQHYRTWLVPQNSKGGPAL